MLKHVQINPLRSSLMRSGQKADTLSINSTMSFSSLHEPALSSRSSSYTSLNETQSSTGSTSVPATPTTTVKVYTRCLRPDLEYKTMCVKYTTTCRDVVDQLLNKYRMKHRDPNLFFLTMEVATRSTGASVRTILVLDDDSCPAQLQACYPRADSRFTVRMRHGGLVKVFDSVLMAESQYKSLLVSERTTLDQLIQLLLNCYKSSESVNSFSLYEVGRTTGFERKLHPDDRPLLIQQEWASSSDYSFVLRKRPPGTPRSGRDFPLRRSFLQWSRNKELCRPVREMAEGDGRRARSSRTASLSLAPCADYDNFFYI
ncbi:uncharacterized protein LOC119090324 [Pollicipes pollicipes]|uniref:uncharacterized protein LOC119090323 n=1 Tax=Pollicipes pollicipes TaxID=41117 RepID=UPI001884CCF8|nr:uncharacterized protein LOC119090323 [Pollicipes pollicipes]XP_037069006.1 uncharacterized protein LOC119090323 [Pollicipes pollicipes]XP_037069008.1 uncharacterized protein LOC119090324 [Pollicipes pollicipes]XP_037069009.1 uncharacterized protein LOC119090324 [Pollicipes pollicipes]